MTQIITNNSGGGGGSSVTVVDNLTTQSSTSALSANQGYVLKGLIDNLMAQGRFLSLWNCATGQPISFPMSTPYTYSTGDYFMVETLDSNDPATNYRPDGNSYNNVASTTVETGEVAVGDYYVYDGAVWLLASNHGKTVSFANLAGQPTDNVPLGEALAAKQNKLIAGDNIGFTTTIGLPSSYTEVVSVKNAANTYVDTGVRISADNAVIEMRFTLTSGTGSFYIWQQRSSTSGAILGLNGSSSGQTLSMSVNGTSITSSITRTGGHTYFMRATYNSGNGTLYVKDETAGTEDTKTGTYTWAAVNKNLFMFGNGLNSSQTVGAGVTVHYAKLTVNGSNKFEACFAKNSSDVVGIYDTVNRAFRTAGLGSLTAGEETTKEKDVIYVGGLLKNTATGSNTLTINGTASANTSSVNIGNLSSTGSAYVVALGHNASATGQYSTAIGQLSSATGTGGTAVGRISLVNAAYGTSLGYSATAAYGSVALGYGSNCANNGIGIGYNAKTTKDHTIQIGTGTNSTANTLQIGFNGTNYRLLDGTTGLIPNDRIGFYASGSTAPASPTEGMMWYDTTNDVLKVYDGSQWNECGSGGGGTENTKTFYLSSTSDLTTAQAAYDWYAAGKNPIISYAGFIYVVGELYSSTLHFFATDFTMVEDSSDGVMYREILAFTISSGTVISMTSDTETIGRFLDTGTDYSTPYTPEYNGSPATKKYVDDGDTVVSGDSGTTYTIKVSNSAPASGTPNTTITFVTD